VRLEDDVERHDVYGRRLAYVYLHGENFEEELSRSCPSVGCQVGSRCWNA
jgi:hypothetical protein